MRRNWKRKKEALERWGFVPWLLLGVEILESCDEFGIWGIPEEKALVDLSSIKNLGKGQLK